MEEQNQSEYVASAWLQIKDTQAAKPKIRRQIMPVLTSTLSTYHPFTPQNCKFIFQSSFSQKFRKATWRTIVRVLRLQPEVEHETQRANISFKTQETTTQHGIFSNQHKNKHHFMKKVKENLFSLIKSHSLASSYILTSGNQQNWQERRSISRFPNMNSLFDVI